MIGRRQHQPTAGPDDTSLSQVNHAIAHSVQAALRVAGWLDVPEGVPDAIADTLPGSADRHMAAAIDALWRAREALAREVVDVGEAAKFSQQ